MSEEQLFGVVKNFSRARGFGFILPDGEFKNGVFFHVVSWRELEPVQNGQRVSFSIEHVEGKTRARNVEFAEPDPNTEYGTVKSFGRGYGFIAADAGDSLFTHFTALLMDGKLELIANQRVSFIRARNERGISAAHVLVIDEFAEVELENSLEENLEHA